MNPQIAKRRNNMGRAKTEPVPTIRVHISFLATVALAIAATVYIVGFVVLHRISVDWGRYEHAHIPPELVAGFLCFHGIMAMVFSVAFIHPIANALGCCTTKKEVPGEKPKE